jgi:acyl-CoA synthetase (NDP forming)/GNAT superfamily N-acetyltransferase
MEPTPTAAGVLPPQVTSDIPTQRPIFALLIDGTIVEIRSASPADIDEVRRLHAELSEDSLRMRFFGITKQAGEASAQRICAPPRLGYAALVAVLNGKIIGIAEYTCGEDMSEGEVAFVVDESYHRRGVGTLLLEHLAALAMRNGLTRFVAYVLSDNYDMRRVFADAGLNVTSRYEDGTSCLVVSLVESERYLQAVGDRERRADVESLRPLLQPRSVVVIGASRRKGSVGRAVFDNIRQFGFAGSIYAVNAAAGPDERIGEAPACRSVGELPEAPDLAVIAVPASQVAEVARDCATRGIRAVVVITSALDEATGEALLTTCRRHGMRLVGPNCFGIAATQPDVHLNATFGGTDPLPGRAGVIVQSGGVGIALLEHLSRLGVGISTLVSVGDKYDVSGNDLLQWWASDGQTEMAILYLESFGNPRKFGRLARQLARRMPVLTVAAGRSEAGQRAAASHTAAAATPAAAREALFTQAGVIATRGLEDLTATAALLAHQPLPRGDSVAIVSNAGGAGVLAADACADVGLTVAPLPAEVQADLRDVLAAAASVANPVDTTAAVSTTALRAVLDRIAASEAVDAVMVLIAPTALGNLRPAITNTPDLHGKPLLAVQLAQAEAVVALRCGPRGIVPSFVDAGLAARALGHAQRYARWREQPAGAVIHPGDVDTDRARGLVQAFLAEHPKGGWLDPERSAQLLESYRIPLVPQTLARSADEAVALAGAFGRPVALKAYWPELVHKTDVGAVRLSLTSEEAVRQAYEEMAERFSDKLAGVVVQPMAEAGIELLAGISHDDVFGPMVVLGLGGVETDVFAERAARLTPLTEADVTEMLTSTKLGSLLAPHRGRPGVDQRALTELLGRISQLADDLPQLVEADFNPVIARPDGFIVVDARIRLVRREAPTPFLRRLR